MIDEQRKIFSEGYGNTAQVHFFVIFLNNRSCLYSFFENLLYQQNMLLSYQILRRVVLVVYFVFLSPVCRVINPSILDIQFKNQTEHIHNGIFYAVLFDIKLL